jgi:hypothetical protein
VNLLGEFPGKAAKGDLFPMAEGRAAARMVEAFAPHDRLVLLGGNVCRAFGLRLAPLERTVRRGRLWLHVPHPSGVNRWWNDPENERAAEAALRSVLSASLRCAG